MKTCPVCGAGAFDDADVCFGCLHRYESPAGSSGVPVVPVSPVSPLSYRETDSQPRSSAQLSELPAAKTMRRSQDAVQPCVPIMRQPVEAATVAESSASSGSRDNAAWVVRFEFPGFAPMNEGCGLLRDDAVRGTTGCDMVVRLQPVTPQGSTERRRGRPSRGSHVRVPDKDDVAAMALSEQA